MQVNDFHERLKRLARQRAPSPRCAHARPLVEVGLGYLSLDRESATLRAARRSGKMVRHLGSRCSPAHVFDEPTIGLHLARLDAATACWLRSAARATRCRVEQSPVIEIARVVDMGPGAGVHPGTVVYGATSCLRPLGTTPAGARDRAALEGDLPAGCALRRRARQAPTCGRHRRRPLGLLTRQGFSPAPARARCPRLPARASTSDGLPSTTAAADPAAPRSLLPRPRHVKPRCSAPNSQGLGRHGRRDDSHRLGAASRPATEPLVLTRRLRVIGWLHRHVLPRMARSRAGRGRTATKRAGLMLAGDVGLGCVGSVSR